MDWRKAYRREERASWEDLADAVRNSVSMSDVVGYYVPSVTPRHHRIPCPLHNGIGFNLSFSRTGFKCFVCNESGDVIEFVRQICSLGSRTDAIRQINQDFRLGLPIGREVTRTENAELEKRRQEARERQEREQILLDAYHRAMDEYVALDRTKILHEPDRKSENPVISAEYIRVCKSLDAAWYEVERSETALTQFYKKHERGERN